MFKVIKFELRKLVSRPGIYILAVLLATLLTVSAFLYKPTESKKTYNILAGETVSEIQADFNDNYKNSYDEMVSSTLNLANQMSTSSSESYKIEIEGLLERFNNDIDAFIDISASYLDSAQKMEKVESVHNENNTGSLDILNTRLITLLGEESDSFIAVATTQNNYADLNNVIIDIQNKFDDVLYKTSPTDEDFSTLASKCTSLKEQLNKDVKDIKYVDYSKIVGDFIVGGNYYKVTIERHKVIERKMNEILEEVAGNYSLNESKNLINEYNDLFNEYRLVSENYVNLFNVTRNLTVLNNFKESDMSKVKFLDIDSYYSLKEQKTRYTYYMEKDTNELSYANALSFDFASNGKTNGFDFTYFSISIFSVILIVFAIMLASYSIAGETKDGTMRFISIRPVSRTKLYWGKFFFIAIISLIMLIFATITSLIVGGIFKTSIPPERQYRGHYGITCSLRFNDNTSNRQVIRSYTLDEDSMVDNPYRLIHDTRQYKIFDIDGFNFIEVAYI